MGTEDPRVRETACAVVAILNKASLAVCAGVLGANAHRYAVLGMIEAWIARPSTGPGGALPTKTRVRSLGRKLADADAGANEDLQAAHRAWEQVSPELTKREALDHPARLRHSQAWCRAREAREASEAIQKCNPGLPGPRRPRPRPRLRLLAGGQS